MQRKQHTMGKNLHQGTSSRASRKDVTSRDVKIINILFLIIRKKLWKKRYKKDCTCREQKLGQRLRTELLLRSWNKHNWKMLTMSSVLCKGMKKSRKFRRALGRSLGGSNYICQKIRIFNSTVTQVVHLGLLFSERYMTREHLELWLYAGEVSTVAAVLDSLLRMPLCNNAKGLGYNILCSVLFSSNCLLLSQHSFDSTSEMSVIWIFS